MRKFELKNWIRCGVAAFFCCSLVGVAFDATGKDYEPVGFELLTSGEYFPEAPESGVRNVVRNDADYLEKYVDAQVLGLDGEAVEIAGYMLPISIVEDKVSEFLILPDTGACCYGVMPSLDGYVLARSAEGVTHFDNVPVRIRGSFRVEEVWQAGFFSHLYFVEVDELAVGLGKTGIPAEE